MLSIDLHLPRVCSNSLENSLEVTNNMCATSWIRSVKRIDHKILWWITATHYDDESLSSHSSHFNSMYLIRWNEVSLNLISHARKEKKHLTLGVGCPTPFDLSMYIINFLYLNVLLKCTFLKWDECTKCTKYTVKLECTFIA